MGGIQFEMTINVGHMLTILFGIVAFVMAWGKFSSRLDVIEMRVDFVEKTMQNVAEALKMLTDTTTSIAILQTELSAAQVTIATIQGQIEGLRRGEGFIQGRRGGGGIDGEYSRAGN